LAPKAKPRKYLNNRHSPPASALLGWRAGGEFLIPGSTCFFAPCPSHSEKSYFYHIAAIITQFPVLSDPIPPSPFPKKGRGGVLIYLSPVNQRFMLRRAPSPPFLGRGRGWGTMTNEMTISRLITFLTFRSGLRFDPFFSLFQYAKKNIVNGKYQKMEKLFRL
jgi:hypothetical protein